MGGVNAERPKCRVSRHRDNPIIIMPDPANSRGKLMRTPVQLQNAGRSARCARFDVWRDAGVIRPSLDGASSVEAGSSRLSHAPATKPSRAFAAHADRRFNKSEPSGLTFSRWRALGMPDLAIGVANRVNPT